MRYYLQTEDGRSRLLVRKSEAVYDLSAATSEIRTFEDLLYVSKITGQSIDEIADALLERSDRLSENVLSSRATSMPLTPEEVWAAGVTYQISEKAREEESSMPDIYVDVYDSDRPELFYKAGSDRSVGPGEPVGIRGDSKWNVPEPELGVVLSRGEIVGYTIGNDMSSREIEGENPLYLPQAKIYDRCCALGPCIRSAVSLEKPTGLEMWMKIYRDDDIVFDDATNTSKMVRPLDELVEYYTRHNSIPSVSVLLTGTSLVPDEDFSLQVSDKIEIGIEGIGVLSNPVIGV